MECASLYWPCNQRTITNYAKSIVLQLAKPLLKTGMTIYADNFYSSVPPEEKLLKEKKKKRPTITVLFVRTERCFLGILYEHN